MTVLTIARRQLGETRWSLLFSAAAFFGLALLWNWGISEYQFREETPEESPPAAPSAEVNDGDASPTEEPTDDASRRRRRRGRPGPQVYVAFGVPGDRVLGLPPDQTPTLLMQVAMANHPLVFLVVLGWGIGRASAAVAGEIERGTLDLTLSRPVRRSTYMLAQLLAAVVVFGVLGLSIAAGHLVSDQFFRLNEPPSPADYLPMVASLAALGLAVFGYTLPISASDLSRARAGIIGLGITLAGIAALIFARQYEDYEWTADLSVFQYYAPVGITLEGSSEQYTDLSILLGIFAAGGLLALLAFSRRDLPSNSG
ncbi:ABC transporter permease [Tautonia sociabilis]|uniref:Uncharacterized protein n=1 Tax=Tautonia sociabilis TaxID=2080755 RepID=A0A432MH26_9BACT|nr:ABC transporter permease subunit [Tautonia sociabilis]RUL86205.1 hypothetical protein TsocGM_16730 [Tautonia sociabilis]